MKYVTTCEKSAWSKVERKVTKSTKLEAQESEGFTVQIVCFPCQELTFGFNRSNVLVARFPGIVKPAIEI